MSLSVPSNAAATCQTTNRNIDSSFDNTMEKKLIYTKMTFIWFDRLTGNTYSFHFIKFHPDLNDSTSKPLITRYAVIFFFRRIYPLFLSNFWFQNNVVSFEMKENETKHFDVNEQNQTFWKTVVWERFVTIRKDSTESICYGSNRMKHIWFVRMNDEKRFCSNEQYFVDGFIIFFSWAISEAVNG